VKYIKDYDSSYRGNGACLNHRKRKKRCPEDCLARLALARKSHKAKNGARRKFSFVKNLPKPKRSHKRKVIPDSEEDETSQEEPDQEEEESEEEKEKQSEEENQSEEEKESGEENQPEEEKTESGDDRKESEEEKKESKDEIQIVAADHEPKLAISARRKRISMEAI